MLPRLLVAAVLASCGFLAHSQAADPNLQNLLAALETGAPVTLITPLTTGMSQVTSFSAQKRMASAEALAYVDRARGELMRLGVQQPTAEEIARMLAGGPLVPAGNVTLPGLLNVAGIPASIVSQQVAAGTPVNGTPGYGTSAAGGSAAVPAREQAIRELAALGIINPSEDQIRTALVGGTITTVNGVYQLPGVLSR